MPSKRSSLVAMCSHHVLYMPLPTSRNFQYSKDRFNDSASFLGLYLPKIPNVNYQSIQYRLPSDHCYADGYVYDMIDDICATDIIKGIIVYLEETNCLIHKMNLEVLDYFKHKQPIIPYALGGCRMMEFMCKGTMIEEDDENLIVTVGVFSVPKEPEPVPGPPCQFNMYSLIIDSTVQEKAAIQKVVQTFAENISELEFSAALMLSSYERERWYAHEPELAVELEVFCDTFPRTAVLGGYDTGEIAYSHPDIRPQSTRTLSDGEQRFTHSGSTVFVYFTWGKQLTSGQEAHHSV